MSAKWLKGGSSWNRKADSRHEPGVTKPKAKPPEDDGSDYGVLYYPVKCPKCKTKNVTCYKTIKTTRYYRCRQEDCQKRFRATEAPDA